MDGPCTQRVHGRVHSPYTSVDGRVHGPYTRSCTQYTAVYTSRKHSRTQPYTAVFMARTHLVRAVYADRKLGRVCGPYTVYTAVSVFLSCTAVYTILTGRKHGRIQGTRPFTRPSTLYVFTARSVYAVVFGSCTAVYTLRVVNTVVYRVHGRVHGP